MRHADLHGGPDGGQLDPDEEGPGHLPLPPAHRGRGGGRRDGAPPPFTIPFVHFHCSGLNLVSCEAVKKNKKQRLYEVYKSTQHEF